MNDRTDPPDDGDLGEPIRELARLRETPSPGFARRIRNSIQRRIATAESLDFSLMALFATFMDYLGLALTAFGGDEPKEGKRR